jgi:hypothetical protein
MPNTPESLARRLVDELGRVTIISRNDHVTEIADVGRTIYGILKSAATVEQAAA